MIYGRVVPTNLHKNSFPPSVASSLRVLGNDLGVLLDLRKGGEEGGASSLSPEIMTKAALTALDALAEKVRRAGGKEGGRSRGGTDPDIQALIPDFLFFPPSLPPSLPSSLPPTAPKNHFAHPPPSPRDRRTPLPRPPPHLPLPPLPPPPRPRG